MTTQPVDSNKVWREPISGRVWPLSGFAPGNYMCICVDCEKQFEGDKRAVQCLDCAVRSVNNELLSLRSPPAPEAEAVAWRYEYLKGYDGDIPLWGQPQLGLADPRPTLGDDVRNVEPLFLKPSPSVPEDQRLAGALKALEGYDEALKNREHGGLAAHRCVDELRAALNPIGAE